MMIVQKPSLLLRFVGIVLLLQLPMLLNGQSVIIDSLENELVVGSSSKETAEQLNLLSYYSLKLDPTKSKNYARQALELSNRKNYPQQLAEAFINLGRIARTEALWDSSRSLYSQAFELSRAAKYYKGSSKSVNGLGAISLLTGELDSAILRFEEALDYAQKADYLKGEADGYTNLSRIYLFQNDFAKADEVLHKAYEFYLRVGDSSGLSNALINLGDLQTDQGTYDQALKNYLQALSIQSKLKLESNIATSQSVIGYLYGEMSDTLKALQYYYQSMALREQLQDEEGLMESYNNYGTWLADVGKTDSAIFYLKKGLAIAEKRNNEERIGGFLINLGEIYWKNQKKLELGQELLGRAEEILSPSESELKGPLYSSLGELAEKLQNYQQALRYFNQELAEHLEYEDKVGEESALRHLSTAYEQLGDYPNAFKFEKRANALKDSLRLLVTKTEIEELGIKYETEKKDLEIANFRVAQFEQARRQNLIIVGGIFLLLLILAGSLIFRFRQQRIVRERELELEKAKVKNEKERIERLRQIDRLKDQFLANTSHELRTPLNGIIGLTEALFERSEDPFAKRNLAMVISAGKRLSSLVNDLLDFSRLKNRDIKLRQKAIDLHALTNIVCQLSAPLAKGKLVDIINDVDEHLPAIWADEDRVAQILFNLMGNAIKFTEQGYIKISASERGEMIEIKVKDTGIGIPADKQDVIFAEFEQADGSTEREFAGTGLGLSISKTLVELHGGKMWVESEEGFGSTFFFSLPKAAPGEKVQKTFEDEGAQLTPLASYEEIVHNETIPTPEHAPLSPLNKFRILIVDDEPINHQVLKNHLEGEQYHLTSALNGQGAIELIEQGEQYDLVLLDVMMPKISGFEVCQQIREYYLPSELPIIMITAKNQVSDLVHGLSTGANDYIAKPFSKDEFLARIKTHLNLHTINSATGKFVPYEFIRALGRENITDIRLGDHVQKEVTVLFSDIRGYTSIAEKMDPEEAFLFVSEYSQLMGPIIARNGGFINQYLGDGIMAIFQEHPRDALRASIEMQKALKALNKERQGKGMPGISVGMGMHTGPLVMGIIGDEKRTDATTIADTVNTASRMEGLTKYFHADILLSEDVFSQVGEEEDLHFRYLGLVQVKGKEKPVGLYECIDSEDPTVFDKKIQACPHFEKGVKLYIDGHFQEAVLSFWESLRLYPEDQMAQKLVLRATEYLEEGVPEDWDGVEMMQEK